MARSYFQISGQSLGRLAALSDGIFAVAMTLLILNVHLPTAALSQVEQPLWAGDAMRLEAALWSALAPLGPQVLTYLLSFLTLGIFWAGQQTQLNHFARSDHRLTWIHLIFLLVVVLMPFSTALLTVFITFRLAMLIYWLNIFLLGTVLFVSIRYARHAGLLADEATDDVVAASERRILVYQALYAAAAALCVVSTYLAIACLILLQLNSVIGPRIGLLNRF
jgi:uncharacterized membrane protein